MGMMGTCACTARWKAPFLKGSKLPVWFLVPSGNTHRRILSSNMVLEASIITLLASFGFLRLMKTMPPSQQMRPTVPA